MLRETALVSAHKACGGKLVDFGGWNMPLHYGSQVEEHHAVRALAGMFDVSHMTVIDVCGEDAKAYLQYVLANNVAKLNTQGQALYSAMLNHNGAVIDDLIVYLMPFGYRLVVNCATRDKDWAWLNAQMSEEQGEEQHKEINRQKKHFNITLNERNELAMIAVQGPMARRIVNTYLECPDALNGLKNFHGTTIQCHGGEWFIARTGYTGEDGYEIMLPSAIAEKVWQDFIDAGISPCGLGARDTLRLEAGMNLYGHEMSDVISPLIANMGWTIGWEPQSRDFIGKESLTIEKNAGIKQMLVGLTLSSGGVLRADQEVILGDKKIGVITSGTFSPTLGCSIALARMDSNAIKNNQTCQVMVRKKLLDVKIVKPTFVRKGESVVQSFS